MNEALNELVGKICSVEMSGKVNIVKLLEIKGNWLVVEDNNTRAFININRIDEISEMIERTSSRRNYFDGIGR